MLAFCFYKVEFRNRCSISGMQIASLLPSAMCPFGIKSIPYQKLFKISNCCLHVESSTWLCCCMMRFQSYPQVDPCSPLSLQ